ncbi:MAG: O-antigen ligase family protein [Brooklawnia sp.]|uniref:O-antigen ligase family protein n=1 Tax=Brooklawnia sp. TaxID=2699740 RepID=UPI003C7117A3
MPRSHEAGTAAEAEKAPAISATIIPIVYAGLLLIIPSRLVVPQIGSPGTPANLWAIGGLLVWMAMTVGGRNPVRGLTPTRVTLTLFAIAVLISFVNGNSAGWFQPADIHQTSDALWQDVTMQELNTVLISAGDRGLLALAGWAGVMLMTSESPRRWADLEKIVSWVVGFASIIAALGIYQYFTGANVAAWFNIPGLSTLREQVTFTRSEVNRVVVTAAHPIELGVVSAAIFPLALHRSLHAGRRLLPWAQTGMILVVLLMSVSRSAIVVLAVAMLVMIAGWPARWRLWALVVTPVAAVALRAALPGLLGTIRALFTNLENDPSIAGRTDDYEIVSRMVMEHPYFGQGLFTWVPFYFRTIDNQALMFALELGLVGSAVFVIMVATHLLGALLARTRIDDRRSRHLALAIVAAASGLLAAYVTFDAISFRMAAGMTFLLLGMAGAVWDLTRPQPQGSRSAVPLDRADHRSA